MIVEIDFNSEEAIYMQLRNQIIIGIATSQLREGEMLPSVRQLAEIVGINMHTVNKAYSVLREEGYIKIDRRRGAVIAIDIDKLQAMEDMKEELFILLARASLKNITADEVHEMIDEIYAEYGCSGAQRENG
ncbi:MAG: GntR family transcriptional regulator [Lachnospiraceae bacterium]